MTEDTSTPARDAAAQREMGQTDRRLSRRSYVRALGASAFAGAVGGAVGATGTASADSHGFDHFVETDGSEFVVDGEPIYFNGSNNFWITDYHGATEERIDQVFDQFEELGLNLVRMWANGVGPDSLQPEPGEYDEEALRLHDYAVKSAGEHGIRLIPSLVDNWDWEGGMLQYAEWAGNRSRYTFYTDDEARQMYEDHVETIVTRENYHTGVEWREDPTIMMWELANEPRLEADAPGLEGSTSEVRSQNLHRDTLGQWIDDMSSYIKELDSNHLVSTGSEGHFYRQGEAYPYGTWGGQDFAEHHSYDSIDAASFHWYPDHWWCHDNCDNFREEVPLEMGSEWIEDHAEIAHDELNIPTYLGEFNVRALRPDQPQDQLMNEGDGEGHDLSVRREHMQDYYETADEVDLNGMIVWQIVLDSTDDHDGFQIYPDEADYIEEYSQIVAEKSGGGTDGPCEEAGAANITELENGQTVCDIDGDGWHRDVNGDGAVSNGDITDFFGNQHVDPWDSRTDLFDFDGDGNVGQGDVVSLFNRVN